jgi:hypothetical protein
MLLILDVDYTLNRFYPPSIQDFAPTELLEQAGPPLWEWIIEHLSTVEYPVHDQAVEVLQRLNEYAPRVVVSTGRPEALREVTERWLRRFFHFEHVFMRKTGDFRLNAEIKRDALTNDILPLKEERQLYAFEDDALALEMYQQEGVRTLAAPTCWPELQTRLQDNTEPANVHAMRELMSSRAGEAEF